MPGRDPLIKKLQAWGFSAARSHVDHGSIKTSAAMDVVMKAAEECVDEAILEREKSKENSEVSE